MTAENHLTFGSDLHKVKYDNDGKIVCFRILNSKWGKTQLIEFEAKRKDWKWHFDWAASLHSSGCFMLKMFRNRKYYNPDFSEWNRRFKRHFEGNFSYRKFFLILFCLAIVLLYIGPYIFAWLFSSPVNIKGEHRSWMWHNLFAFKLNSSQSKYRLTYVLIDSE